MTFCVTGKSNLEDMRKMIAQETKTANNIKSRTNRHAVQESLQQVTTYLKTLKEIPTNGMCLLSGRGCQTTNAHESKSYI